VRRVYNQERTDGEYEVSLEALYAIQVRTIWRYLKSESIVFWLICAYIFFEYVRPQSIYPALDFIPYAQTLLIATLVVSIFQGILFRVKNVENGLILAFVSIVILSSIFAYSPAASLETLLEMIIWVFVYFMFINIINTERRFFIVLLSFLLYSFKMSQFGFRSWVSIGFAFRDWGVTGAPGYFHNAGELGVQLCIFLPLVSYFIVSLRKYWSKPKLVFFLLFPLTAVGSIIATSSRGALVAGLAVIVWMMLKSKSKIRGIAIVLLILPIVFLSIPDQQIARLEQVGVDQTSENRLLRWEYGINVMHDNPVLGIGYNNWGVYRGGGLSHNIFIDAGAELGYTGLLIFLLMIFYTFVNNARTRKVAEASQNDFAFRMAHGFDAALIGFLVAGSFVSVLYYPFFWINLAFTVALNNIAAQAAKRKWQAVEKSQSNQMIESKR